MCIAYYYLQALLSVHGLSWFAMLLKVGCWMAYRAQGLRGASGASEIWVLLLSCHVSAVALACS